MLHIGLAWKDEQGRSWIMNQKVGVIYTAKPLTCALMVYVSMWIFDKIAWETITSYGRAVECDETCMLVLSRFCYSDRVQRFWCKKLQNFSKMTSTSIKIASSVMKEQDDIKFTLNNKQIQKSRLTKPEQRKYSYTCFYSLPNTP